MAAHPPTSRRRPFTGGLRLGQAGGVFVRVWRYEVARGCEPEFERTYAPDGAWARLFARSDGFVGTELFASLDRPGTYLTVDTFTDAAAWTSFLERHAAAYAALDRQGEGLTTSESEVVAARVPGRAGSTET